MAVNMLRVLMVQTPLYLAWLIGIGLALVFFRRHPTVSLLAGGAFTLLLISSVAGTYLSIYIPMWIGAVHASELGRVLFLIGVGRSLVDTAAAGMLIAAVFGWRRA